MKKVLKKQKKKLKEVRVLVFSGYGLNCEEEAAYAFEVAGAVADIVHINDVIGGDVQLKNYQILVFPGGFAYGDDTGAGKAYGNRVKNHLWKDLQKFLNDGKLILGICNGQQILSQIGLLPGAFVYNENNRYTDRWVDMNVEGDTPWLRGIKTLSCPIAHGEGRFVASDKELADLSKSKRIALRYIRGETAKYQNLPANPNGSMEDVAGVLSHDGRVFGLMPHPDRAFTTVHRPDWPLMKEMAARRGAKLPEYTESLQIFKNGVDYIKGVKVV
jgi:phosphoribosylformylglycinamidine synthase